MDSFILHFDFLDCFIVISGIFLFNAFSRIKTQIFV